MPDKDENKQPEQETEKTPEEIISELKENTVPKNKYEELEKRHNKMMAEWANGKNLSETEEKPVPIGQQREELFGNKRNKDMTNLEFWERSLKLRKSVMEETGQDIFVAENVATAESYESAEKVADVVQQCIDAAKGDSNVFTNELQRRTNDIKLPIRRK